MFLSYVYIFHICNGSRIFFEYRCFQFVVKCTNGSAWTSLSMGSINVAESFFCPIMGIRFIIKLQDLQARVGVSIIAASKHHHSGNS